MRMNTSKAAMIGLFMFASVLPSHAATIIVQSEAEDGKDISLYQRTDLPLSSGPSLYVINTGPPGPGLDNFASLVEFDLAHLSPTTVVMSAHLWLYENNVSTFSFQHVSTAFPNTIEVQPAATSWTEGNTFYSTLPQPLPEYSATQIVDRVATWFSWDVTDAVREWLNGALANNGFLITSKCEVRDGSIVVGSAFDASEQTNPPYLEIELMNANAGDYNLNGEVDAADYVMWRTQFGSLVDAFAGADGSGDGIVNAADYTVWRDHFGNSSTNALKHVALAEPQSAAALVLVSCLVAARVGLVRGRSRVSGMVLAIVALVVVSATTNAAVIPYSEEFVTGTQNWKDATNTDVTHVSSGGLGGTTDGYISVQRTFTANPNTAQTVFRGHDQFNSSSDPFVGDWLAAGITRFSFWVRHHAATDLTFGTRFATSANSPGANGIGDPTSVPANVWTMVSLRISPTNIFPEGPPSLFDTVFGSIGNLQISARPGNNLNVPITFDLDRVTIVPEPTTSGLCCIVAGFYALLAYRRLSTQTLPVALFVGAVFLSSATATFADTASDSALTLTPLPEPLASFGAATHDGWLYIYGGHVGETHEHSRDNVRGNFRRQRLSGGEWQELPPGPAVQSPALVAHGKFLYRLGGLTARNTPDEPSDLHSIDSVARYAPDAGCWNQLPSLPAPRSSHDAVVLGDRIYLAGGWHHHGEEGSADWHDSLLVLDLSVNDAARLAWRKLATTPFMRRAFAMATYNGRVYCIGGMTPDTAFSRRVDVYDPQNDTWSRGPSLPESEMHGFGASAFEIDRRLYVSSLSDKLYFLSEDERDWLPVALLEQPRFFHRIVPGGKSRVLLVGGAGHDSHLDSIIAIRPKRQEQAF